VVPRKDVGRQRHRTPDEVVAIRQARAAGMSVAEIAATFRCSESTVRRVIRGATFSAQGQLSAITQP